MRVEVFGQLPTNQWIDITTVCSVVISHLGVTTKGQDDQHYNELHAPINLNPPRKQTSCSLQLARF